MNEKQKQVIHTANIQRAFVATVARAFVSMIDDMIDYCKVHNIIIPLTERRQLINIKKAVTIVTSDYIALDKDKADTFKQYSKIMAVVIQQLFSKTDGDYMTMFKFYNYVKTFPTTRKEIEVPTNKEADAFAVIFGNHNNNNS